jgi:VWFA-related protein
MARLFQTTSNSIRVLLITVLIILGCGSLFTQDNKPKQEPPSTGNLVKVFAAVRDAKGSFRNDLLQKDFTLKEDGKKQDIAGFSVESDLPLTIGLIIDCSAGMQGAIAKLQEALRVFFYSMFRPGKDKFFIIKLRDIEKPGKAMMRNVPCAGQIELFHDLTAKPVEIEKTIYSIGWEGYFGEIWDAQFETMLADSIIYAATKKFMLLPSQTRKALIVLSDGDHIGNHLDLALENVLEADAQIFAIHIYDPNFGIGNKVGDGEAGFSGQGGFGEFSALGRDNNIGLSGGISQTPMGPDGQFRSTPANPQNTNICALNLQLLSAQTGGASFEYGGKKSLEDICGKIEKELRSYYSIGYYPLPSNNKGCRRIKVEVKDGYYVHATESYCPTHILP